MRGLKRVYYMKYICCKQHSSIVVYIRCHKPAALWSGAADESEETRCKRVIGYDAYIHIIRIVLITTIQYYTHTHTMGPWLRLWVHDYGPAAVRQ